MRFCFVKGWLGRRLSTADLRGQGNVVKFGYSCKCPSQHLHVAAPLSHAISDNHVKDGGLGNCVERRWVGSESSDWYRRLRFGGGARRQIHLNTMTDEDSKVAKLVELGLEIGAAKAAARSSKTYEETLRAMTVADIKENSPAKSVMIYSVATKLPSDVPESHRDYLYKAVGSGRIERTAQLEAAMEFVSKLKSAGATTSNMQVRAEFSAIDDSAFDEYCGVGRVVTDEEINAVVDDVIGPKKEEILEKRYRFKAGPLLKPARERLRFVDGKIFLEKFDQRIAELLGPMTEEDKKPPPKVKAKKEKAAPKEVAPKEEEPVEIDVLASIPANFDARGLESAKNTPELVEKQRAASGGKVVCRFPPEPNGYLHIGHAKAMYLDFGYAKKAGGNTILRFDDTNPEVEDIEYINAIIEMVGWLGHTPAKITYSSDYFEELFELAKELIRRDKAYVDHQTAAEASANREQKRGSPWRNRPIEESLQAFEDMRKGKFEEGAAVLRMKIDMTHDNPVMRDPVAYRIKFHAHPKSGDKWCIYPSYDFTHCLVDSLEWVTHSLCTLEFEIRRDSYYWLLAALDLYRPFVWEFARLSLEYTIVSKRKLLKLVTGGYVRGWDDPRMPTLVGLRRRGYPPEAINKFCASIGVTRADNNITGLHVLEHAIRSELDATVSRAKAVLHPLKLTIVNMPEDAQETLSVPNHPTKPELGTHEQVFCRTVYIERSDFRVTDETGYYGLAPGKTAMLRHAYPVTVKEVILGESEEPVEILVEYDKEKSVKPKGVLHWVAASPHSKPAEIRMYDKLFKSAQVDENWLDDLNPNSETILHDALVEDFAAKAKVGDRFQFERVGFFVCDSDSTEDRKVFNLTVSLKASYKG